MDGSQSVATTTLAAQIPSSTEHRGVSQLKMDGVSRARHVIRLTILLLLLLLIRTRRRRF